MRTLQKLLVLFKLSMKLVQKCETLQERSSPFPPSFLLSLLSDTFTTAVVILGLVPMATSGTQQPSATDPSIRPQSMASCRTHET